jgi:hypothetical protein
VSAERLPHGVRRRNTQRCTMSPLSRRQISVPKSLDSMPVSLLVDSFPRHKTPFAPLHPPVPGRKLFHLDRFTPCEENCCATATTCDHEERIVKLFRLMSSLLALVAVPGLLAKTIHVPKDQPTIQDGINAANNGDTVLVAPGKYVENINFNGKAIIVTSAKGPKVTVIDGNKLGPVATFISKETTTSVLRGFTLENGVGGGYWDGGGAAIAYSSPTINQNIIVNNEDCGIGSSFGSPAITNNVIRNNKSGEGGGVLIGGATMASFPPILSNNIIEGNSVYDYSFGGGVSLYAAGTVIVENNKIINNQAPNGQGGGMYIVNEADEIIVQNLIANNYSTSGSQIYSLVPQSSIGMRLINNTIVSADPSIGDLSPDAAVVADGFNANVLIVNNIIFAPLDGAALLCNPIYQEGPPMVQYNDAFNTLGVPYGDSCTGMDGTQGNISGDPEFVLSGKIPYELQPNSPAINAGSTSAPDLPKKDLAGHPRIVNGKIDMGAYEHQGKESDRK